jgi:hypothetical protein
MPTISAFDGILILIQIFWRDHAPPISTRSMPSTRR